MTIPPTRLHVENALVNGHSVVRVRGEIDLRTSPHLRATLLESSRRSGALFLIDLSQVQYMDSSGVGTMVYIKREVERAGHRVILAGLQPRVRSVLEITHLDKFFTIVQTVDEGTRT
jgi:anti-sigma B factor antagonist